MSAKILWNSTTGAELPVVEVGFFSNFWEMEGEPVRRGERVIAGRILDWYIGDDYVAVDDLERPTVAKLTHQNGNHAQQWHFRVLRG